MLNAKYIKFNNINFNFTIKLQKSLIYLYDNF